MPVLLCSIILCNITVCIAMIEQPSLNILVLCLIGGAHISCPPGLCVPFRALCALYLCLD